MSSPSGYPTSASARDRWVVERRPDRSPYDPWSHQGILVEDERQADGRVRQVATVFLTGRECPWRCAMCDLWRYTTTTDTPAGAIAAQVASARAWLASNQVDVAALKLYNAGSFFDPRAVPEGDYDDVAAAVADLSLIVVECHPSLVGSRLDRFTEALGRQRLPNRAPAALEVAMGLETAHPAALEQLNKRFTLQQFAEAAGALASRGAALRVFLLVSPPFVAAAEQDDWLARSVDAAFDCGASVVSLVPTRSGNGAMEELQTLGWFRQPDLPDVERALELALDAAGGRGRVFADLWDIGRFVRCSACAAARRERIKRMNLRQTIPPAVACTEDGCGAR